MIITFDNSLLSRDESNAIKGILILLIMLGHNIPFVDLTDSWMVMVWLYLFHIQSFFILPYLYPVKRLTCQRFLNLITKYYVPFILFSVILFIINILKTGTGKVSSDFFMVLIGGGAMALKTLLGTQFLWFLPAMCICCIIKEAFMLLNIPLKTVVLLLGICMVFCDIFSKPAFIMYASLGYFRLSFKFLFLGMLIRFIIQNYRISAFPVSMVFFMGSVFFFIHYRLCLRPFILGYQDSFFHRTLALFMSSAFILLMYDLRTTLTKSSFLKFLGANSFIIYLSHCYFGYLGNWFLSKLNTPLLLSAFTCFVFVLGCSVGVVFLMNYFYYAKALFFPNSTLELKHSLKIFVRNPTAILARTKDS